jgi:hypothetical protein
MEKTDVIHKLPDDAKRIGVITSGPVEDIHLPGYTEKEVKKLREINFVWFAK